jgi:hypothetical protein
MGLYGLPTRRHRALAPMTVGLEPLISRYFRTNKKDDDGYETGVKLIPDPRVHFDVEFELLGAIGQDGALAAQSRSTFTTLREFEISTDGGEFKLIVGGDATATGITAIPGLWRFKFDGTDTEAYRNGSLLYTIATNAGNDFSLDATFSMCMSRRLTTIYENFYLGVLANVLVRNAAGTATNGYAIESNSNDVPDTIGSADATVIGGLTADWELYTKQANGDWLGTDRVTQNAWENPVKSDDQWTFSNDKWSLAGDGSYNGLQILALADQPSIMQLITVVDSISGAALAITGNNTATLQKSATGTYTDEIDLSTYTLQEYKRRNGSLNVTLSKPSIRKILR